MTTAGLLRNVDERAVCPRLVIIAARGRRTLADVLGWPIKRLVATVAFGRRSAARTVQDDEV
jgi:hypothetical protein